MSSAFGQTTCFGAWRIPLCLTADSYLLTNTANVQIVVLKVIQLVLSQKESFLFILTDTQKLSNRLCNYK